MKKFLVLIILSFGMASAYAQQKINETKQVMHQALDSLVHLMPYVASEMKFKDPQYEKEINLHLSKIVMAFKSAKHIKDFQAPGFAPNYEMIKEHLDDTLLSFNSNDKTFARFRMASTTSLCLSCHAQLPKDRMTSYILDNKKVKREIFENEFEYAHFLFLLRKYKKAVSAFEKSIAERFEKQKEMKKIQTILGSNIEQFDRILYNSFRGVLSIYTKVLRRPQKAVDFMQKYLQDTRTPRYLKRDLAQWIKDLQKWLPNQDITHKLTSDAEIEKFLTRYIAPIDNSAESVIAGTFDVDLLVTSGVLSNYLTENPKTKLAPKILYWLGICENRLNKNIFYSMGDLYLKECINRYSADPVAKKCFNEYENELLFRYTGSIGTKLPISKQKELNDLKDKMR